MFKIVVLRTSKGKFLNLNWTCFQSENAESSRNMWITVLKKIKKKQKGKRQIKLDVINKGRASN